MRKLVPLLLSFFLASAAFAQEQANWQTVSPDEAAASADCDFSAEMPGIPELRSETKQIKGRTIRSFIYTVQSGTATYSLNCSDYPIADMLNTRAKTIAVLKRSARAQVGGTPKKLKEVEVNGYPGVAFVQQVNANASFYHRAYVVEGKLYQLTAGDLQGGVEAGADRFFQSFSVE